MSNQFKVGDLALITAPDNFGRCVELVSRHVGPCGISFGGGRNQIVPTGCVAWVVAGTGLSATMTLTGVEVLVDQLAFGERWLKPLRGDFAPAEQKSQAVPV